VHGRIQGHRGLRQCGWTWIRCRVPSLRPWRVRGRSRGFA
jgi:hypothetical protein